MPQTNIGLGASADALPPIFLIFCLVGAWGARDGTLGFRVVRTLLTQAEPIIALDGDVFGSWITARWWRGDGWLGLAVFAVGCL